jgi:hypothetical protein
LAMVLIGEERGKRTNGRKRVSDGNELGLVGLLGVVGSDALSLEGLSSRVLLLVVGAEEVKVLVLLSSGGSSGGGGGLGGGGDGESLVLGGVGLDVLVPASKGGVLGSVGGRGERLEDLNVGLRGGEAVDGEQGQYNALIVVVGVVARQKRRDWWKSEGLEKYWLSALR